MQRRNRKEDEMRRRSIVIVAIMMMVAMYCVGCGKTEEPTQKKEHTENDGGDHSGHNH